MPVYSLNWSKITQWLKRALKLCFGGPLSEYGSKSCLWTFLSQRLKSISNNIFYSLETTVWATSIQTILSLKIFPLAFFVLEIPRNYTQPQCEGHPADTFKIAPIDLTLLVILFILKGLWRQTSRKPAPLKSSTVGDTFIVDLSSLNRWVSGEQLSLVVCSLFLAAALKEKYWDWHLKEKSIAWWLTQETGLGDMSFAVTVFSLEMWPYCLWITVIHVLRVSQIPIERGYDAKIIPKRTFVIVISRETVRLSAAQNKKASCLCALIRFSYVS